MLGVLAAMPALPTLLGTITAQAQTKPLASWNDGLAKQVIIDCVAVWACAAQVQNKEDMLAAAGFTVVPASTSQRQGSLAALPPHKFVHQVRHNTAVFTYADPTICDCLYVGNQAAYDRYRQEVFAKNLANEQQMTAQIDQMDWGPWGPGWYY